MYLSKNKKIELFNSDIYKNYFAPFSIIASYWKDMNAKLYKENETGIGSGFFWF